jgi:hypothetical protein
MKRDCDGMRWLIELWRVQYLGVERPRGGGA